jgi:hypothetical protein
MKHPEFIIIGAAKCGTTSLFDQLSRHPEAFSPNVKEPGFFIEKNHLSSIRTEQEYIDLFAGAEKFKTSGEATVLYMAEPNSPELIRKYLGDNVRIIVILRNPIDMAYSLWKHRRREVKEELGFFEAIEKWPTRASDAEFNKSNVAIDWDYIGRARFYEQLQRFRTFKNMKILIFEDYVHNSKEQFSDLCRFLGISDHHNIDFQSANTSFSPRFKGLQRMLTHQSGFKETLKKIIPVKRLVPLKSYVESLNKSDDDTPPLSIEERQKVKALLEDDVRKLEGLLNRDLGKYWKDFTPD